MRLLFTDATVLRIIDSGAIVLAQAYQLVRMRLSSCCQNQACAHAGT